MGSDISFALMVIERPKWYRLERVNWSIVIDAEREEYGSRSELVMRKFDVIKTTPRGVWLNVGFGSCRFVLLDSRKRFACPTEWEAMESFKARKLRQHRILQAQLHDVEMQLQELDRIDMKRAIQVGL